MTQSSVKVRLSLQYWVIVVLYITQFYQKKKLWKVAWFLGTNLSLFLFAKWRKFCIQERILKSFVSIQFISKSRIFLTNGKSESFPSKCQLCRKICVIATLSTVSFALAVLGTWKIWIVIFIKICIYTYTLHICPIYRNMKNVHT